MEVLDAAAASLPWSTKQQSCTAREICRKMISILQIKVLSLALSMIGSLSLSFIKVPCNAMFQRMFHIRDFSVPRSRESVLAFSAAPPAYWPTFAHQSCTAVRPGPRHTALAVLLTCCQWSLHLLHAWQTPVYYILLLLSFLLRFHCTLSYPKPKEPRSASADVCKLIKRRPTQGYVCTHHPRKESTLQRQRIRPLSYFWHLISWR